MRFLLMIVVNWFHIILRISKLKSLISMGSLNWWRRLAIWKAWFLWRIKNAIKWIFYVHLFGEKENIWEEECYKIYILFLCSSFFYPFLIFECIVCIYFVMVEGSWWHEWNSLSYDFSCEINNSCIFKKDFIY